MKEADSASANALVSLSPKSPKSSKSSSPPSVAVVEPVTGALNSKSSSPNASLSSSNRSLEALGYSAENDEDPASSGRGDVSSWVLGVDHTDESKPKSSIGGDEVVVNRKVMSSALSFEAHVDRASFRAALGLGAFSSEPDLDLRPCCDAGNSALLDMTEAREPLYCLDGVTLSTTRKRHIRRLNDLLYLCLERDDLPRARRAWAILTQCKEFDWKGHWRTGLLLVPTTEGASTGRQKVEMLRKLMRFHSEDVSPSQRHYIKYVMIDLFAIARVNFGGNSHPIG